MKLHFLTSLCVGVHTTRRCPYRALLCDHENKRFILIVLREEHVQGDGRLGKALQHLYTRVWDKSPFSWGDESTAHRVVALEVDWSSIVGVDYRCPLHDDGRLVLEARYVVKRCFKTVEDVRDFYSPRTATCTGLRRSAHSAAPTPSKVSFEGRPTSRTGFANPGHPEAAAGHTRPVSCSSAFMAASAEAHAAASFGLSGGACGAGRLAASHSEAGPGPAGRHAAAGRSVSASRIGRLRDGTAGHWGGGHGSHEWRTAAAGGHHQSSSQCPGAGRRHRSSASGFAAAAAAAGGAEAAGMMGAGARRRLNLRDADHSCGLEAKEEAARNTGSRKPMTRAEMVRLKHTDALSPRRTRSAGDLASMGPDTADTAESRPPAPPAGASESGSAGSACDAAAHAARRSRPRTGHGHAEPTPDGAGRCGHRGGTGCGGCGDAAAQLGGGEQGGGRRARGSAHGFDPLVLGSGSGSSSGGGGGDVPRASRWTLPSASYSSCTLALAFRDPFLPQELRRFVKSDLRLLKLYESGLPPWAVLMPCYGLPYRPWMRRALWLIFIAISIFSMGCGFYDLYKNVPFLKQVMTAVASRLYLPAAELFEWLERHTQIRMSILLTYLFSKSPLLVSFMRALRSLAALLQQLLRPAAAAVSGALQPLGAALSAAAAGLGGSAVALGGALWSAAQPVVAAVAASGREVLALLAAVLGPPARLLWALAMLGAQLCRLVAALLGMLLTGPLQLACSVGGALSWAGGALGEQLAAAGEAALWALQWVATLGRAARRVAPVVSEGARAAAAAAQATGSAGGGGVGGGVAVWRWLGLEVVGAYNAVRLTFVQAFKSLKAVIDCLNAIAQKAMQHRVSLLLQLRRFITRQKERLPPAVAASVPLPAFVTMPSFDGPTPGPPMAVLLENDRTLSDVDSLAGSPTAARHPVFNLGILGDPGDGGRGDVEEDLGPSVFDGDSDDGGGGSGGEGALRGSGRAEAIAIPGISGGGLRRRRVGGGGGGQLPGSDAGGGGLTHGLYRRRLDAVHEEETDEEGGEDQQGDGGAPGPRRTSEPSGPWGQRSRLSQASRQPAGVEVNGGRRARGGKAVRFAPEDLGPGFGSSEAEEDGFGEEDRGGDGDGFLGPASAPGGSAAWTAFALGRGAYGVGVLGAGGPALSSSLPSQGRAQGRLAASAQAAAGDPAHPAPERQQPQPSAALPRGGGSLRQQRQGGGLPPHPRSGPRAFGSTDPAAPGAGASSGAGAAANGRSGGGGGGGSAAAFGAQAVGFGAAAAAAAVGLPHHPGAFTVLGGAFAHPDLVPLARHLRSSSAPLLVRPRSLSAPGDGPRLQGLGNFASVSIGAEPAGAWAMPAGGPGGADGNNGAGSLADAAPAAAGSSTPQCGALPGVRAPHIKQQQPGPALPVEAAC